MGPGGTGAERTTVIESIQDFTAGLPPLFQWLGIMVAGAIPFVESYAGSVIGVVAGLALPVAVGAAVAGNIVSMSALVLGTSAVRDKVTADRAREESPKRRRLRTAFDKYGVAGVSLVGQTILTSQITSAAMVSFGASRNAVIFWQYLSILRWGVSVGRMATSDVDVH